MSWNAPATYLFVSSLLATYMLVTPKGERWLREAVLRRKHVMLTMMTLGIGSALTIAVRDGASAPLFPFLAGLTTVAAAAFGRLLRLNAPAMKVVVRQLRVWLNFTVARGWLVSASVGAEVGAIEARVEKVIDEFPQHLIEAFGREDVRDAMLLGIEERWGPPDQWLELNRRSARAERSLARRLFVWAFGRWVAPQR